MNKFKAKRTQLMLMNNWRLGKIQFINLVTCKIYIFYL